MTHRFQWSRLAMFGLAATWAVCATRGDTGASLWQAQSIFALDWLLFEAFDVFSGTMLLPLNALGFLCLSVMKRYAAAPGDVWQLLAPTACASAVLRARRGREWRHAITLAAGLAAAAMMLKLEGLPLFLGLAAEAELFFLAGVQLDAPLCSLTHRSCGCWLCRCSVCSGWRSV